IDTLPCECLTTSLTAYTTPCTPPSPCCCNYFLSFCVTNICETPINATVTITDGTLSPVAVFIPAGSSCDTFQFNPSGSFTGGWEYISCCSGHGTKAGHCV